MTNSMSTPVSFSAFVVSLATTAAVHFGDVADPSSGQKPAPNFEAAGHAIEMLALLEEKTKGNLTDEEERFLKAGTLRASRPLRRSQAEREVVTLCV